MSWFWIALTCALSLALADSFTKKYFSQQAGLSVLLIRLSLPGLVLLPYSIFQGLPVAPVDFWYLMLLLVPLEIIAMWFYVLAIKYAPLHLSLPYLSFTPVIVILTGYLFLGETITWDATLGIVLIVVGAYLLNIQYVNRSLRNVLAPFAAIFKLRGSVFMLITALIYSVTSVLGKKAMLYTEPIIFGAFYYSVIGSVTLILVIGVQPRAVKNILVQPKAIALVSVPMAIMVVSHFIALEQVETAYVIAVKRTSMIFAMLLGAWMFKDMNFKQHLPAGLIMLTGVALLLV